MRLTAQGLTGYGDMEWEGGQSWRWQLFSISQACSFPFLNQQQPHRVEFLFPSLPSTHKEQLHQAHTSHQQQSSGRR